jgi:hypothetical protein
MKVLVLAPPLEREGGIQHYTATLKRALKDLIALLYANEGLPQRIGDAAAKMAQQYTWDRNAEEFNSVLRALSGARATKSCDRSPTRQGVRLCKAIRTLGCGDADV